MGELLLPYGFYVVFENKDTDTGRKRETSHFQGFLKMFGVWYVFKGIKSKDTKHDNN